ncbi:AAA family ATPase [Streptomyces sp. NPDC050585]|uniref:AAA family ATPase n=1 Tax=Streptomyces sp. NPDC050585 TaxID=3365632 RepID=UPI0037B6D3E4
MPDQRETPDLAVLVGLQAAGKSTFYRQRLADRYALVSKDLFPRGARNKQRRQMAQVAEALAAGRPVAVDNTNPSPEEWGPLVSEARAHGATATAYWFPPDVPGSLRRNAARHGRERVPEAGFRATLARLRRPSRADGFDAVLEVRMDGRGGFTVCPAPGGPPPRDTPPVHRDPAPPAAPPPARDEAPVREEAPVRDEAPARDEAAAGQQADPAAGRHREGRPGYPPTDAQDPTHGGGIEVTVPEENRPKTTTTDDVIEATETEDQQERQPGGSGRSLREAMEEAGVRREDYEEK